VPAEESALHVEITVRRAEEDPRHGHRPRAILRQGRDRELAIGVLDVDRCGQPGIPVQTIRNGIVNQQRTINALSSLKC